MKRSFMLIGGLIVISAALVLAFGRSEGQDAEQLEFRITAQRLEDGRTEFGMQQREDGVWGERILPSSRFFPAQVSAGRWLNSSPILIEGAAGGVEQVEVIREVEVIKEVEVIVEVPVNPTLSDLPQKPSDWLPLNHDSERERSQTGREWSYRIDPGAESTSIWQYSDSQLAVDFLGVLLACVIDEPHPIWVLHLPDGVIGDSDELRVEYFIGDSITYYQEFLVGRPSEQDTSFTSREDATTVLSLIAENRPRSNNKDLSIRIIGEGGSVRHELSTYFLHRLARSDDAPDPLDNLLYCGQYGDQDDG